MLTPDEIQIKSNSFQMKAEITAIKTSVPLADKQKTVALQKDHEEIPETSLLCELTKEERKKRRLENLQQRLYYSFLGVTVTDERDAAGKQVKYEGSYHDEKNYVHGDYVLVFPNPDHVYASQRLNFTFNFTEMLFMVNKFFVLNPQRDQTYTDCFNRALGLAFNQLKDAEKQGKKSRFIRRINAKSDGGKDKPADNELYEDIGVKFYDEKVNVGGGFLIPPKKKGGGDWTRSKLVTKDLCTLFRHVFLVKLAHEFGFKMRSFLNDEGDKIFTVLHVEQSNLHLIAEESQIDKEIELAISDIMSLEPVDSSFRPLRLHSFLNSNDYFNSHHVRMHKQELMKLKKEILEQLELIDYRHLCRQVNCKLFFHERESAIVRDEASVGVSTWRYYLEYLKLVAKEVAFFRDALGRPMNAKEEEKITDNERELAAFEAKKLKNGPQNKFQEIEAEKMRNESTLFFRSRKELMRDKTNTQIVKRIRVELLAQKYKHIFSKSLQATQRKHGSTSLMNLWNHAGVKRPYDAFSDFYNPTTRTSLKKKNRLVAIWKKYQLNEVGLTGVFLNMEKLKLIQRMFDSMFNLSVIRENGFMLDYFFINDPCALNGVPNEPYFQQFRTEFLATMHKSNSPEAGNNSQKLSETVRQKDDKGGFSKIRAIEKEWTGLLTIPLRAVRDYYGEKIALFLSFLNYYIYCSFFMIIFSIPMFFLQRYFVDSDFFHTFASGSDLETGQYALQIATLIFCIVIACWACLVSEIWEGKEAIFAIKYGQTEFELEELELSSFEGAFHRSFFNDNMNEEYSGMLGKAILVLFAMLFALVFFIGNVAVHIGMSYLAVSLDYLNEESFAYIGIFVVALINTVYVLITGYIYEKLSLLLTNLENHRTASDYELSFTVKVLLFKLINRMIPLVMIAFVNDYFGWGCGGWHCWDFLLVYYRSMLYVFFIIQCLEYGLAGFIFLMKKAKYELFSRNKAGKPTPFGKINKYLYQESIKLNFSPSEELDGTLSEFINMTINFSMNSLFGVCFPMCFPMSALIFFISQHFIKFKLIKLCKRPKPLGAATIGATKSIFHLVGYLAVLSNAGLICYTTNILHGSYSLSYFVILVMGIFFVKFVVQKFVVKIPDKLDLILKRGNMVAEKCVKSSKKSCKKSVFSIKQTEPIYKIYGCLLESRQKKKLQAIDEEANLSPGQVNLEPKKG